VQRHEGEPSALAWLVALISMVLPWLGAGICLYGGWLLSRSEQHGWWYMGAGAALMIADVVLDVVWAHPTISKSDQPDLNRRTAQLVGRILIVEEAIEGGRGKVRVGDTLWLVEGPDMPAGAQVRVAAHRGNLLVVERPPD
jgi:membrane protein implicated in regulation of membrane protease activity